MFLKNASEKTTEFLILAVVTLMYIAMCAEADIYVPAFPQMVEFFNTTEDKIQLILSLNFIGLCLAGLICGPLSDTFGRRKVLLGGLSLFAISSFGCVFANQFTTMLAWRILQGMSASVPMVVGAAVFLDKYSLEKASRLIGILNSVITAAMAGAPILGSYLVIHFNWRLNFTVIAILAVLSFLGSFFFIEETLNAEKRKPFNLKLILKDYATLASSFKFIGYSVISLLPLITVVVYISNLSLIFINHLNVSPDYFGYYQASTMIAFLIFSAASSPMIAKKGMDYTKNLGGVMVIIGSTALFLTALYQPDSVLLICGTMCVFTAGGALIIGIFGMKALDLFPEIKGTAAAMTTAIRQLLASSFVLISEVTFDGTIVPVAVILFSFVCVAVIWYLLIIRSRSHRPISDYP